MAINTQQTFLELIEKYHKNPDDFVFFVGAGLSIPLFPSWKNLLNNFLLSAEEKGYPYDITEIRDYIENGENYLNIAETCIETMGENRYRDIMEETFDIDILESNVPEGYQLLMDLSPKSIITTNYDRLFDISGKGSYRIGTNKNASEIMRAISNNKKVVFKMHGDIMDHSSIVLKASDYDEIINSNQSTTNLLTSILSTKKLIFIGFSLSDPHLDILLKRINTINSNIPISHYALLNETSKFKVASFESSYSIKVISYTPKSNNHPEVGEFLRALNHKTQLVKKNTDDNKKSITTRKELLIHMDAFLDNIIIDGTHSIFLENEILYLSFSSISQTTSELQKEITFLISEMNFVTDLIDNIVINIIRDTLPSSHIDDNQKFELKCILKYTIVNSYAKRDISTTELWKNIDFFIPKSVSSLFVKEESVIFPLNRGLL